MTERLVKLSLAVVAAAALTACGSLAPTHERPAAPVPGSYEGAGEAVSGQSAAADIAWQDYFQDATLRSLIDKALANNRDLRVAVLNIERAREQYRIARADRLPTVAAVANGQRQTTGGAISSVYTAGLGVTSFELDLFGRVQNLSDAALANFFAIEENRKAAQVALISQVAISYLNLAADEALLEATRETLRTREESMKLTQLKFDHGVSSELDLRQAQSLLETARVALAQQTRQRALDQNALSFLIGEPVPAGVVSANTLAQQTLRDLPAGVPSDLLNRRPDIRAAEQALMAANANIGAARAAFFPRITLTGSAGFASTELSSLFDNGGAWSFMPQLVLPIFDMGRNRAALGVAKVNREIAIAQYEQSIQNAFREVSDGLAGRATLSEQLRAQRAVADAETARFKLSDLRYRNGVASYLELLDAQRSLFQAQQAVVQTQAAQAQNLVNLYKVLGGGWTEPAAGEGASDVTTKR